ncbi:MAG TPA: hypothetical protein VFW19_14500 [Allosphingosinicella sp.]|nr:hypothetical protein [Allosphingosinicella sp.]
MDSLRAFGEEADYGPSADEEEAAIEAPPEIGTDERRMHVRAYNHWVSLLDGKPYPAVQDLDPHTIEDFGPNSVLLDFSDGEDPKIAWLGNALREECGLTGDIDRIGDVPARSLLSRLTDHYLQIIANRAPIGFEAEFVGQRGHNTMYRGILMPFTSNGEDIDFIYGVINWKEIADSATSARIAREAASAIAAAHAAESSPVWADGPNAEPLEIPIYVEEHGWDEPALPFDAGLADRLVAARDCAEAAAGADARSRSTLYRALGHAYDFALAAAAEPDLYAELLADAGITIQERAPMTAVAKLVFGAATDKARLTEFAAGLAWARRQDLPMGGVASALEAQEGGLKAWVQAERRARRPAPKPDTGEEARAALRARKPLGHLNYDPGAAEFVLLVACRDEVGGLAIVAPVTDPALLDKAIRKAVA